MVIIDLGKGGKILLSLSAARRGLTLTKRRWQLLTENEIIVLHKVRPGFNVKHLLS